MLHCPLRFGHSVPKQGASLNEGLPAHVPFQAMRALGPDA